MQNSLIEANSKWTGGEAAECTLYGVERSSSLRGLRNGCAGGTEAVSKEVVAAAATVSVDGLSHTLCTYYSRTGSESSMKIVR